MRTTLIALSLAVVAGVPSVAAAQSAAPAPAAAPSDHTITGNVGLFSEYRFRGISQTFAKPALQGGFDYAHSSGIYLGNWNSNVSSGAGFPAGNLEMDFYGGWKKSWGDWGLDVGAIYYYYPGTDANAAAGTTIPNFRTPANGHNGKIDNKEIYIGGSWKWISAKYYYSLDDYFSLPGTKGSSYLDLSATYDLGGGWGVVGHVGSLKVKGYSIGTDGSNADYTDWKIGVTKDIAGWVFGASYIDTNAKGSNCGTANAGFYCFANSLPNGGAGTKFKDAGKSVVVLSVSKSF
jgi:uncharacterized protein (TIGR02001 family)